MEPFALDGKIKGVAFDLDGTLVDAYKAVSFSLNKALKDFGYSPADDYAIQRAVGWGERKLIESFVTEEDVSKVHSVFRQYNRKGLQSSAKFLPGARKLLRAMKEKGYKLAVATNRPRYSTEIILYRLDIFLIFDCIICPEDVQNFKPSADALNKVMQKMSLSPEELIYVGDMTVDVETGHNAGVKTIAVVTGSSTRDEIAAAKPFKIVDNLTQLMPLFS